MLESKVTVIIPSYKSEGSIKKAILSVIDQGEIVERIIVVEDGVYDKTNSVVRSITDKRVELISFETNKGAQKARNEGLKLTKSKYVIFLDSDDYFEGDFILGLISQAEDNSSDVCLGRNCRVISYNNKSYFEIPSGTSNFELLNGWLLSTLAVGPTCIIWNTDFCKSIGGWDETIVRNQDGEIITRALINNCKVAYSVQGAGCTVQHNGFRISKIRTLSSFMSQEKIYENINRFLIEGDLSAKERVRLRAALNWFCINICVGLSEAGFVRKEYSSWQSKIRWKFSHFVLLPKKKAVQVLSFFCFGRKAYSVKNILKKIVAK